MIFNPDALVQPSIWMVLPLDEIYEEGWVKVDAELFEPAYCVGFQWIVQRRMSGEIDGH